MNENEIKAVLLELNRVEVHGENNLDILLGCISFMKTKLREIERIKKECLEAQKEKLANAKPEIDIEVKGDGDNGR